MGIELRCPAGQVELFDRIVIKEIQNCVDGISIHDLCSFGSGIDVTVEALLVAQVAEIDLEGVQRSAPEEGKVAAVGVQVGEHIVHV